jgi:hypothetical protein
MLGDNYMKNEKLLRLIVNNHNLIAVYNKNQ